MDLDIRLKKLASGVSAREAAQAHAKSLQPAAELSSDEQTLANEFEATLELMFLMAAVDGEISDEELEQLAGSIQAVADMHAVDGLELGSKLNQLNESLEQEGWSARMHDAARRIQTPDGRTFAFRLAAGVAFVDDHVAHAEAAAIDSLASALELDADESQSLLREVVDTLFG
ncbi:MAG: tellurite resistance TerB family protein [Myxococcales bacterium]|nr:tellurite resistance TerB family protein [Myxococcales bacterium]